MPNQTVEERPLAVGSLVPVSALMSHAHLMPATECGKLKHLALLYIFSTRFPILHTVSTLIHFDEKKYTLNMSPQALHMF